MSEIAPSLTTSAPRKPRARRKWALAFLVILTFVPLHWLLFQGREVVPGVIARPVGLCDVEWFERRCPHHPTIGIVYGECWLNQELAAFSSAVRVKLPYMEQQS